MKLRGKLRFSLLKNKAIPKNMESTRNVLGKVGKGILPLTFLLSFNLRCKGKDAADRSENTGR